MLFLIAIVYTIALVIATLVTLKELPSLGSSFDDKIYHLLAYLGLGFLWLSYFKPYKTNRTFMIVFMALLFFGIVLEVMQHQINANRTYDSADMISNCIGVSLGTLLANFININKLN